MKQNKFYFKGMIYTDEETFWKATREWPFKKTDQETFSEEWEHFGKQIWLNIEVRNLEITNGALNEILEENFLCIMDKIFRNALIEKEK